MGMRMLPKMYYVIMRQQLSGMDLAIDKGKVLTFGTKKKAEEYLDKEAPDVIKWEDVSIIQLDEDAVARFQASVDGRFW